MVRHVAARFGGRVAVFGLLVVGAFTCAAAVCPAQEADVAASGDPARSAASDAANGFAKTHLIQAALRAAAIGDDKLRTQLAEQALQATPDDARAHWLSGEVQFLGKWQSVSEASTAAAADPKFDAYLRRREKVGVTAADQFALGKWCHEQGLMDEARGHLRRTLELQPDHRGALALLELQLHNGTWMTRLEIEAYEKSVAAAKAHLKAWQPQIAAIVRRLASPTTSSSAAAELSAITDPTAIPALEATLITAGPNLATPIVDTLRKMPQQWATESLLRGAVLTRNESVRKAASTALKQRPMHDYVPVLLSGLVAPAESTVEVNTSGNQVVIRQVVTREGDDIDQQFINQANVGFATPNVRLSFFMRDALSQVSQATELTQKKLDKARRRDEAMNQRIVTVLKQTTGEDFGSQARLWWDWWQDYNDTYASPYRPVAVQQYDYDYDVPYQMPNNSYPYYVPRTSCFAKGTPVWTLRGLRPIDEIQIGDRILSQDPDSGELAYKGVLATTLRRDRPMVQIQAGQDSITSTRGHVFWVAGEGWRLAKELNSGQKLYGLRRAVPVEQVVPAANGDSYNLVVADFATYFVGDNQLLVHDTTPRKPTLAVVPGLVAKE